MIELIGLNAGVIWNALNESGEMDLKKLKKLTKVKTEKELCLALGWLAKEGKLEFSGTDKNFTVKLKA